MTTSLFASAAATGFGAGGVLLAALAFALFAGVLGMAGAFGTVLSTPGITYKGIRDSATRELATRVDAKWQMALKQRNPREWWLPFVDIVPTDPGDEIVKLPIDLEDLGAWTENLGTRVAPEVRPEFYAAIVQKPWMKDRSIKSLDIKRNSFGTWPDRLSAMMLSSRRMLGVLVRDMLFSTGSAGTSSTFYTYQGGKNGTQPFLARNGHYCDPNVPAGLTFGNMHTGSDQVATSTLEFVPGATAFNAAGWELIQKVLLGRTGPGGVPLDQQVHFVLGGSQMAPVFKKIFKRVLVLEDSASGPAAAAVTNIHGPGMQDFYEEPVVPVVTAWLDSHPYKIANPTKQQYWTLSTTYPARGIGAIMENGGAPTVKVLDIGSEYEQLHDRIYVKGDMALNVGAAFPWVFDEWRET